MIIYLSIGSSQTIDYISTIEPCKNWNCLASFQYKNCLKGRSPADFKNFMADSGAFTAMNAGIEIDGKYIDSYIDWINKFDIKNFIEMDLDEIIGYKETKKIRKYIESKTNKKPIPCWHFERGEQGWLDMCKQYDYVSLSLSRATTASKWMMSYNFEPLKWFMKVARENDAKVHALGCNDFQLLKRYHFFSADSSVHSVAKRFGIILTFNDGVLKNNKNKKMKIDTDKVEYNNVKVMMEAMRYAEAKL